MSTFSEDNQGILVGDLWHFSDEAAEKWGVMLPVTKRDIAPIGTQTLYWSGVRDSVKFTAEFEFDDGGLKDFVAQVLTEITKNEREIFDQEFIKAYILGFGLRVELYDWHSDFFVDVTMERGHVHYIRMPSEDIWNLNG